MRLKIKKTGSFKQSKKYIDLINQATVYDTAIKTPITFAKNISKKLANDVFLKREDLQPVFLLKIEVLTTRFHNCLHHKKN